MVYISFMDGGLQSWKIQISHKIYLQIIAICARCDYMKDTSTHKMHDYFRMYYYIKNLPYFLCKIRTKPLIKKETWFQGHRKESFEGWSVFALIFSRTFYIENVYNWVVDIPTPLSLCPWLPSLWLKLFTPLHLFIGVKPHLHPSHFVAPLPLFDYQSPSLVGPLMTKLVLKLNNIALVIHAHKVVPNNPKLVSY